MLHPAAVTLGPEGGLLLSAARQLPLRGNLGLLPPHASLVACWSTGGWGGLCFLPMTLGVAPHDAVPRGAPSSVGSTAVAVGVSHGHGPVPVPAGALQIESSEETDQGKYECVATNSAGVRYSSPANLYVRGRELRQAEAGTHRPTCPLPGLPASRLPCPVPTRAGRP